MHIRLPAVRPNQTDTPLSCISSLSFPPSLDQATAMRRHEQTAHVRLSQMPHRVQELINESELCSQTSYNKSRQPLHQPASQQSPWGITKIPITTHNQSPHKKNAISKANRHRNNINPACGKSFGTLDS
mmetsp:Transcript_7533/g.14668  ORF Transcript_7533/g.14668 Transcript_7533/m.14668 type:complete len:129 (+) Transcript_7533:1170-1556(+)